VNLYPAIIENLVLPLSDSFTKSRFWTIANELAKQNEFDSAAIRRVQQDRLHRLFEAARQQTKFWPPRLQLLTNLEDLQSVAPISKSEVEQAFPDQIVSPSAARSELRFSATNGTTHRLVCVHDFAKRDAMRAAMTKTLRAAAYRVGMPVVEIPPNVCDTVCGELGESDDGVLNHITRALREGNIRDKPVWRDARGKVERNWIYRKKTLAPFDHQGSNQPAEVLDEYIRLIQEANPHTLKGLSTYLLQIAKRCISRGDVALHIPAIRTLGSQVTSQMRATIESAFGGSFYDDYGTAELGPVAAECESRNGMHVFATQFVVEILDQNLSPCSDGTLGEVVITDLTNLAMPLIRYRVGDLGRITSKRCVCGSSHPRLWIEGRLQDALKDFQGNWVSSAMLADRLYKVPWLDEFQLVEREDGVLDFTVVLEESFKDMHLTQCREELSSVLLEIIGEHRGIRLIAASSITPEPGGKFRWVKAQQQIQAEANA